MTRVEQIPVSFWMLAFVLIGSGIDYLRTKKTDKRVLSFFALAGLVTGYVSHWANSRWGGFAWLIAAIMTVVAIGLISRRFILDYIIGLQRTSVSDDAEKEYLEFNEEVEKERQTMKSPSGQPFTPAELRRAEMGERRNAQKKRRR